MGTIRALKRGLATVNLTSMIVSSLEDTDISAIALNQDQLFESSIDRFGRKLTLYSSPLYAINKNRLNPLPGLFHPDLYFTGAFYKGFEVNVGYTGTWGITSSDSKTAKLTSNGPGGFGPDIFGLTPQNATIYALQRFYPVLQQKFTKATGLIFR